MESEANKYELVGEKVRIFKRGEKWYANFQLNGRQHRKSLATRSKKEAQRRALVLDQEIRHGKYKPEISPASLSDVIAAYQAFLATERRAKRTIAKYGPILARLQMVAEDRKVCTVAGIDMKLLDYYRTLRVQDGCAPKTVYCESVVVRQMINFALSRKMVGEDPLCGLKLTKPKPTEQPCWSSDEVERILKASGGNERAKFIALADTGMRVGELRYLTWSDVDFANNKLLIRPKDDWKPKTGDRRSIPMSARVRDLLKGMPRKSRWVFTAAPSLKYPKGDHQFSDRHLLVSLKRVLKRLGMEGKVHTFRHAFISQALMKGTPEAIVRQWVGHVDAAVMKLYTHIADAASQSAMARLSPPQIGAQNGASDGKAVE